MFKGQLLRAPSLILMSLGISTVITSIHSESTFSLKTSRIAICECCTVALLIFTNSVSSVTIVNYVSEVTSLFDK